MEGADMTGLFKIPKSQPVTPTPPATMPDPNSPSIIEAKRKSTMDAMARAGRASTILSAGNSNNPSGDNFASNKLGG